MGEEGFFLIFALFSPVIFQCHSTHSRLHTTLLTHFRDMSPHTPQEEILRYKNLTNPYAVDLKRLQKLALSRDPFGCPLNLRNYREDRWATQEEKCDRTRDGEPKPGFEKTAGKTATTDNERELLKQISKRQDAVLEKLGHPPREDRSGERAPGPLDPPGMGMGRDVHDLLGAPKDLRFDEGSPAARALNRKTDQRMEIGKRSRRQTGGGGGGSGKGFWERFSRGNDAGSKADDREYEEKIRAAKDHVVRMKEAWKVYGEGAPEKGEYVDQWGRKPTEKKKREGKVSFKGKEDKR